MVTELVAVLFCGVGCVVLPVAVAVVARSSGTTMPS
eukprot:COSAG05_NODE_1027_length_6117_cov_7.351778_3_plen_36_part_00